MGLHILMFCSIFRLVVANQKRRYIMSENRLMFWQRMARHYTTVMGRSAPLYREVCSRIRPHLNRDMNVLELACGTGQLSFPLSPYVRLWEATDFHRI